MNGWDVLASGLGSVTLVIVLLIFFGSDAVVDIITAWKKK